ncbi:hypothetical protein M427DRAFT_308013 [Gonapodya prolifera JEL478]|uniref:Secreted protein n=1 Tax=Gonapodya prolifera (strain JEL478) TaxID=1344416 RepID=A0A139AGZ9_GONPJ|nr:hypothetical protein M427DRAFT_308013 [Gonapodya prolifera JEL478]|eukprot:KXS16030.1 hypothetical protein M427DRAFT_308013 [Gonapodya prolifera JEL478]
MSDCSESFTSCMVLIWMVLWTTSLAKFCKCVQDPFTIAPSSAGTSSLYPPFCSYLRQVLRALLPFFAHFAVVTSSSVLEFHSHNTNHGSTRRGRTPRCSGSLLARGDPPLSPCARIDIPTTAASRPRSSSSLGAPPRANPGSGPAHELSRS